MAPKKIQTASISKKANKNVTMATNSSSTSTGPLTRSKAKATAIPASKGVAQQCCKARSLSPRPSRSVSDADSSTGSHSVSSPSSPKHSESPSHSESSYSVAMQAMTTGAATVEEQLATMARAIEKLTKTVEEKDLQIASFMNKLEAQNVGDTSQDASHPPGFTPQGVIIGDQNGKLIMSNQGVKLKQQVDTNRVSSSNPGGGAKFNHATSAALGIGESAQPASIASLSVQQLQDMIARIKPHTFEELATRAHDMEINIANHGGGNPPTIENSKYKNGIKSDKLSAASTEESMVVSMIPVKITRKDKKKEENPRNKHPTLKELQEKRYPYPDADVPSMLEDLLEKEVVQLPECKRPEEMGKIHDPRYCHYHRIVSHPTEKCFVLKDLIADLARKKKILLDVDEVAESNHTVITIEGPTSSSKIKTAESATTPTLGAIFKTMQFGLFDPITIQYSSQDVPIHPHLKRAPDAKNDNEWIPIPQMKSIENKHKIHSHQVKKSQVKKSFPQFTVRNKVNDGKDKKEKVFEKSSPTPITQHDFFPEGYFDDNCFQTVYMISADEEDDISQSSTHRVSAFDRIEAPTARTSVFERLNKANRENNEVNFQPRRPVFSRLKDAREKSKTEHKKQKVEEAMLDSTKEDEETRSSIPSRMKRITSLEVSHDGPLKVRRLTIVLTKPNESQVEGVKKEQVVSIIP
ncbi:hypothetical protein Vadar_013066 [Vaccinium darrowii]|uniref:Uncharacterized protein n=1 Tax=Vaccinium darrowii TaxID=229202 RepID=A0ACB7YUT8_9ERIC|nr:hypothetical protein Vadar_013066 [Vaccinium darrowii]